MAVSRGSKRSGPPWLWAMALIALIAILGQVVRGSERARGEDDQAFFEAKVRPILVERCEKCHGAEKQKSGLRLDARSGWERGGNQGPAIVPGNPDESLLVQAIRYDDILLQMPPDEKLPEDEIATLTEWVRRGAFDPRDGAPQRLGGMTLDEARHWWSFQPVIRPALPDSSSRTANPIDAFVQSKLVSAGITPAGPADKRTLIRRATYDLTGLPPAPEEAEAFLADESPEAFARVVDRLLASPQYGERWGKHWLDLVRYADTAGENSDHPVPQAWRYRNWVIESFNRDQPYDAFLRDQVAGDILAPEGPAERYSERLVATGFLAIARRFGHDIDKDMHLTFEDTIDTLGKSVLGLTIGCARCHAHKYDPISNEDYYALYGILASTRFPFPGCEPKQQPRDLVPLRSPEAWEETILPYRERLAGLDAKLGAIDAELKEVAARLKGENTGDSLLLAEGQIDDGGSEPIVPDEAETPLRVQVSPGQMLTLVVAPRGNHGADSTLVEWEIIEVGGASRVWNLTHDALDELLAGNPHRDSLGHDRVWCFLDARDGPKPLGEAISDLFGNAGLHIWRNGDTPSVFVNATDHAIPVWTSLPPRTLFVHPAPDGPVAVGWLSPIEGTVAIRGRIADAHPGGSDGVAWRLEHMQHDLAAGMRELGSLSERRAEVAKARAEVEAGMPRPELAYAVAEGQPGNTRLQLRGDPEKLGAEVSRRWLEVLGGDLVADKPGSGRRQLAEWLTEPSNPLTARVMVNRVWQHHFGEGIVATPNDFGSRGKPPTHPELLDWLAAEFMESGWRIKPLHRLIMLSDAYQRASAGPSTPTDPDPDPENQLLGRFRRRRLSAEEIRDSLLALGGKLDFSPGGPHPFPPENTWGFTQHNPFSASYETNRRSVYLMLQRNRRDPFLVLFDGADPNATTPQRQETTVPTQALYFLNSPFFHARCDDLAERLLSEPSDEARLDLLFALAFQRRPDVRERIWSNRFLEAYAAELPDGLDRERSRALWAALARVLLSSNEFLYLD